MFCCGVMRCDMLSTSSQVPCTNTLQVVVNNSSRVLCRVHENRRQQILKDKYQAGICFSHNLIHETVLPPSHHTAYRSTAQHNIGFLPPHHGQAINASFRRLNPVSLCLATNISGTECLRPPDMHVGNISRLEMLINDVTRR